MNGNGNPQLENGYLRIANEIVEALMQTNLTAYQSRIIWAILRKTYGYNKKENSISISLFERMTGIRHGHVSRTLKELQMRNIVTRQGTKTALNKNYTGWRALPSGVRPYRNDIH